MAKGNASKVIWNIAQAALATKKDRQSLYSECVIISYRTTGRFAPGFDNKDLQAWIDLNHSHLFDKKGKRITE